MSAPWFVFGYLLGKGNTKTEEEPIEYRGNRGPVKLGDFFKSVGEVALMLLFVVSLVGALVFIATGHWVIACGSLVLSIVAFCLGHER